MSIKKSMYIRVLAAITSLIISCVIINISIVQVKSAQTKNEQANDLLQQAINAEVAHYKWSLDLSKTIYENVEFTGSLTDNECALGQWLYSQMPFEDSTISALRNEITPLHKTLHESASEVLSLLETDKEQAINYYNNNIQKTISSLISLLNEVITQSELLNQQSSQIAHQTITFTIVTSIIFSIISLLCLLWLIQYVITNVIKPIMQITKASECLNEGRLQMNLDYSSNNELGKLADMLKKSLSQIDGYVSDINRIMDELSNGNLDIKPSQHYIGDFEHIETSIKKFINKLTHLIKNISQSSAQVFTGSEQVSTGAQALSQGATEQASSIEELAATISDISQTVNNNTKMVMESSQGATKVNADILESSNKMKQSLDVMSEIKSSSNEISKIIKTIEDIAFQTNILALNAAVEAARAGSAGKGFAVVADEVRNLAGKSAEASQTTTSLIETSLAAVEKGTVTMEETAKFMENVVLEAQKITDVFDSIALASEEQANSISQVTIGIDQISGVIQTNSATSQQSAAASEELSSQAQLLNNLIAQFKLPQSNEDYQNIKTNVSNTSNVNYSANDYSTDDNVVYSGFGDDKY